VIQIVANSDNYENIDFSEFDVDLDDAPIAIAA
jgi:hypothetical protein